MSDKPEAMTEAHTPTPWRFEPRGKNSITHWVVVSGKRCEVAQCHQSFGSQEYPSRKASEANVAYIVLAVNSHARLLKEREELRAALEVLHNAPYKLDALCGGSEYMAASARAEILLTHRRATAKQE